MFLLILLSFSIEASIFATIGMKGLSFASPQAAQVVQTAICASNPASCAAGYLTQQITGELMAEVAKQSPEVAKAIEQYNQVKGWVDEGAKIAEDLKLDDKGGLAGGSMTLNDKERELGPMINPGNKELSVKATNTEVSTQGEGADVSLTTKKDGYVEINGKRYDLKENSKMIIDREGNIKETDATFSEATTIELGGVKYDVPKNGRIIYKEGVAEMITEPGETVKINDQQIKIGEGSIKYDSEKITGKDFTIDNKRFTGIEDKPAEVKLIEEGYLLGKNTKMEDDRMIINSEKGDVLYAKVCEDVSGFSNYVNPCRKTLTAEGNGFSVSLKEGKQFGLDVEKGDTLKYGMQGGKVILENGEQTILTREGKSIKVTNGEMVTKYVTIDGVQQALVDPDVISGKPDVDITTKTGELVAIEDSETGTETIYACPAGSSGAAVVTGAASILERCKAIVGLNTGGSIVGKAMWAEDKSEIAIEEDKLEKFDIHGKTYYSKIIRSNKATYSIFSDGSVRVWDDKKLDWIDADFTVTDEHLKYFGIPKTHEAVPTQIKETISKSETLQQKVQQITKPIEQQVDAFEKMGDAKWAKDRKYMESKGEGDIYGIALTPGGEQGWITSLPGGKGVRSEPALAIKDSTGKIIKYESISSPQTWVPIGGGRLKLVPVNR